MNILYSIANVFSHNAKILPTIAAPIEQIQIVERYIRNALYGIANVRSRLKALRHDNMKASPALNDS